MLPFNFNHLYYFYVVAKNGSFSEAARELRVSQSSISVQVKELENDLGHTLFHRVKTGVELTESGTAVFQHAEEIFHDVERIRSTLEEIEHQVTGSITVGTVNSIGIYVLPEILKTFKQAFPDAKVAIDFKRPREIIALVNTGRLDLAILTSNRKYAGLTAVPLRKTKMFLVAPADHPLAAKSAITTTDLEAHPFIGYEEGMETRSLMDAAFRRLSLSVEYVMESSNVATIKHMVLAGLGMAVLPEAAVGDELRRGLLVRPPFPGFYLAQEITVYYKSNRTMTPTRREFMKRLEQDLGERRRLNK